jgi:redox-sensitive bicupin YhaK (pirin superfamily)
MTSGSGILHEELPRRSPDGNVYGFQLWVNLPSHMKMSDPRYQEVSESEIPIVEKEGLRVRVVAGEFAGLEGPVTQIAASPVYLDVELNPLSSFEITIPPTHTAIAYVFNGKGIFGEGEPVQAVKMVEFEPGERVRAESGLDSGMHFMLIAGAPFAEPIAPYGPFVMNTQEQIHQAFEDLRSGTFVKVSA